MYINKLDNISENIEKKYNLQNNNPKGYNKHLKNPAPKTKAVEVITKETICEAYRELWLAKRKLLSAAQKYSRMHKMFLGLDKIDEEFKGE